MAAKASGSQREGVSCRAAHQPSPHQRMNEIMSSAGGQDPLPASTPRPSAPETTTTALRPPRRGRFSAWFRRSERPAQHSSQERSDGPASAYRERAVSAFAFAERAREPSSAFLHGAPDALLCELYRQSAYWALLALGTQLPAFAPGIELAGRSLPEPGVLFRSSDAALLLRAAGSREALLSIQRAFVSGTFDVLAEWDLEPQASTVWDLRRFARSLVFASNGDFHARRRRRVARWLRVALVPALLAAIAGCVLLWMAAREQRENLAIGRAWRTSSVGAQGCQPPLQECDEAQSFFFHTEDEKAPWLEIDLGKATSFSAVRIVNRLDCCSARATPLVVEVSDDQASWREVARQPSTFKSWKATFPTVRGRYVRVRALTKTILHLAQVRVLP